MFVIFLKFSDNKSKAPEFMDAHNAWLKQGFDDGVFILAGSLQAGRGGGILAQGCSLQQLQQRMDQDPFVAQNVVVAEISEITPALCDERLQFLMP